MGIDRSRRTLFDEVADLYDEVNKGYPEELIDDTIALSGILDGGRILEVGCGTGQATLSFAERDYAILAIELGKNLAAIASKNLQAFPKTQILNMAFEDWEVEENAFDLFLSVDAFHWVPPEIGYPKMAQALKHSGAGAIVATADYHCEQVELTNTIAALYKQITPEFDNPLDADFVTSEFVIEHITANYAETELFTEPTIRKYPMQHIYNAEDYIKSLRAFSSHKYMDKDVKERLYSAVGEAIEKAGGTLMTELSVVLLLAKLR